MSAAELTAIAGGVAVVVLALALAWAIVRGKFGRINVEGGASGIRATIEDSAHGVKTAVTEAEARMVARIGEVETRLTERMDASDKQNAAEHAELADRIDAALTRLDGVEDVVTAPDLRQRRAS